MAGNMSKMKFIKRELEFLGKIISCQVQVTEEGIQVLLAGGDKAHIGAVSIADSNGERMTRCFPGHREDTISEKWSTEINKKTAVPVVVSVGIHYDHANREEIRGILEKTDTLLSEILEEL